MKMVRQLLANKATTTSWSVKRAYIKSSNPIYDKLSQSGAMSNIVRDINDSFYSGRQSWGNFFQELLYNTTEDERIISELNARISEIERIDTESINAELKPEISAYLEALRSLLSIMLSLQNLSSTENWQEKIDKALEVILKDNVPF